MHATIGHNFDASEEETISIWEAIEAVKKGLAKFKADAATNAGFLAQARRNNLPSLTLNLEELLKHYQVNMPRINTGLAKFRVQLKKLEKEYQRLVDSMWGINSRSILGMGPIIDSTHGIDSRITHTEVMLCRRKS
jgi:hypothetical protein